MTIPTMLVHVECRHDYYEPDNCNCNCLYCKEGLKRSFIVALHRSLARREKSVSLDEQGTVFDYVQDTS